MIKSLYEDKYIIVCVKPVGVLSEYVPRQKNMPELLKRQTRAYKVDTIHRLDRNVGGVMIYSKSSKATLMLSKMMSSHRFVKEYFAVVDGCPTPSVGTLEDDLIKDKKNCKVYVAAKPDENSKHAVLNYEVIATKNGLSLVKISLLTGRTHQIRVQFSSRGWPICGDTKYGSADGKNRIALWSYHLNFNHPVGKREIDCKELPPRIYPFNLFELDKYEKSVTI